jgi:hypothetical protein
MITTIILITVLLLSKIILFAQLPLFIIALKVTFIWRYFYI